MPETEEPGFEQLDGNIVVCTTCWALVWFTYMAHHAKWHEEQCAEPAD